MFGVRSFSPFSPFTSSSTYSGGMSGKSTGSPSLSSVNDPSYWCAISFNFLGFCSGSNFFFSVSENPSYSSRKIFHSSVKLHHAHYFLLLSCFLCSLFNLFKSTKKLFQMWILWFKRKATKFFNITLSVKSIFTIMD